MENIIIREAGRSDLPLILDFIKKLAKIAVELGCGRLEWSCLDWNTPSIEFYRSLGAVSLDGWTGFRLTGEALENMAR